MAGRRPCHRGLRSAVSDGEAVVAAKEVVMSDSVYKVIELIGTSKESWEKAAEAAVDQASRTLRDLRIAEIVEMDIQIDEGKARTYRTKVRISFKYQEGSDAVWANPA